MFQRVKLPLVVSLLALISGCVGASDEIRFKSCKVPVCIGLVNSFTSAVNNYNGFDGRNDWTAASFKIEIQETRNALDLGNNYLVMKYSAKDSIIISDVKRFKRGTVIDITQIEPKLPMKWGVTTSWVTSLQFFVLGLPASEKVFVPVNRPRGAN